LSLFARFINAYGGGKASLKATGWRGEAVPVLFSCRFAAAQGQSVAHIQRQQGDIGGPVPIIDGITQQNS